jgi:hypothetical protein
MTDTTAPPVPADPSAPPVMPRNMPPALDLPTTPAGLRVLMGRYKGPEDLDGMLRLAKELAKARTAVPVRYRDSGDMLALMQHAQALDIALSTAWDNLHFNPDGVGGMRARLMHGLLIRAGHHVQPVHHDDKIVRMFLRRNDGKPSGGAQWTLAEAIRNRLPDKDRSAWVGYSGDMLWARCLSRLARRWAPDVVLGFYAAEELGDIRDRMDDDEQLEPADMRTAMRDADGNFIPAPDVVELLTDADTVDLDRLRHLWKLASEEGMLGAYAGTVDGVQLSVRELLFDLMSTAEAKIARTAQGVPVGTPVQPVDLAAVVDAATGPAPAVDGSPAAEPHGDTAAAEVAADHAADAADLVADVDVDEAPAGTGKLKCGCWSEAVAATGRHEPDCKRSPL